jgi:hypothetical protein
VLLRAVRDALASVLLLASLLLSLYMDWFVDPSRDDNTRIIIIIKAAQAFNYFDRIPAV